jgi:hypothetical protein
VGRGSREGAKPRRRGRGVVSGLFGISEELTRLGDKCLERKRTVGAMKSELPSARPPWVDMMIDRFAESFGYVGHAILTQAAELGAEAVERGELGLADSGDRKADAKEVPVGGKEDLSALARNGLSFLRGYLRALREVWDRMPMPEFADEGLDGRATVRLVRFVGGKIGEVERLLNPMLFTEKFPGSPPEAVTTKDTNGTKEGRAEWACGCVRCREAVKTDRTDGKDGGS